MKWDDVEHIPTDRKAVSRTERQIQREKTNMTREKRGKRESDKIHFCIQQINTHSHASSIDRRQTTHCHCHYHESSSKATTLPNTDNIACLSLFVRILHKHTHTHPPLTTAICSRRRRRRRWLSVFTPSSSTILLIFFSILVVSRHEQWKCAKTLHIHNQRFQQYTTISFVCPKTIFRSGPSSSPSLIRYYYHFLFNQVAVLDVRARVCVCQ